MTKTTATILSILSALILAFLLFSSCGEESPEDRLFDQLPMEVKSCITDRTKIVHGIDVSKWQGSIDWSKVAQAGYKFAFIRVSDGLTYIDSYFPQNWAGAKNNGIIRGAYQFFRPNQDAIQQAQLLLDKMGPLQKGDLPPVIDVENTGNLSPAEVAAQIGKWINYVESKLGIKPIIYSGYYFWKDNVKSTAFGDYLLWLPWYHDYQDTAFCPSVPDPWTKWTFWQWTDKGSVPGISGNVDLDIFDGTIDDLKKITYNYEEICGDNYCGTNETYQSCPQDCLMMNFVMPKDGDELYNPVLFKVEADANITKVNYYADGYLFGTSTKPETYFTVEYTFNTLGERVILAEGFDRSGKRAAATSITIKVLATPKCGDGECNGEENHNTCSQDCVNISFITPQNNEEVHNPVTFKVEADKEVVSVIYTADIYKFATSSDRNSNFEVNYKFNVLGNRKIIADGYNANNKKIATTYINIKILEEIDASAYDTFEDITDTTQPDIVEDTTTDIIVDTGTEDTEMTEDIKPADIIEIKETYSDVKPDAGNIQEKESSGCGCSVIE
jgi:lysozyme